MLIGLAAGALLSGLLVATAPRVVPALPLAAVITALALSVGAAARPAAEASR